MELWVHSRYYCYWFMLMYKWGIRLLFWFQRLCDIYWKSPIECIGIVNLLLLLLPIPPSLFIVMMRILPYEPHIWIGYRWKNDCGLIILKLSTVRKDMLKSYLLFERICLCFYGLFTFEIVVDYVVMGLLLESLLLAYHYIVIELII